ncbi:hypothetical protein [Chryseobacterium sp.]|uniref:hypothetical protein n=1 Tax=Chryseobacterium sp. TaxID=1871047 RepID=UPI00388D97D7
MIINTTKLFTLLGIVTICELKAQQNSSQDSAFVIQHKIVEIGNKNPTKINFYGFIRHDAFYDTRQNIGAGENIVMLYPKDRLMYVNGEDINNAPKFHMLSILLRAGITVNGPEILGAKTNGILEGEFFGATEGGFNEFRLRHAYVTSDWKNTIRTWAILASFCGARLPS